MYSEHIAEILRSNGIEQGDSVRLSIGKKAYEGTLMPRPESGDGSILILKLKNGYNIGVRFAAGSKISKAGGRNKAALPAGGGISPNKSLSTVSLIYTGGTIGSKVDYLTGGVHMLTKPQELISEVPEILEIANLDVKNLMSIASEDMSYLEWQKIAQAAADSLNSGSRGVLITHGTDTMHYTAAALSFMLKNLTGPVVITGAQRSADRGSSDAFMNLVCGMRIAAQSDIAEVGICMHSTSSDDTCSFIRGTHVRKMHTSRRDAFRAINQKPIARIGYDGKMEHISEYRRAEGQRGSVKAVTGFDPTVAFVKIYPNSDPGVLEYYGGKGYRGAILEGTGLGHAPVSTPHTEYNWLGAIKRAVDSGMVVGVTSQCIYGRVNDRVYRNLRLMRNAGATYCQDMMPEVAYVKLGWLLANYKEEEARRLLGTDISGEISARSEPEWQREWDAR